MPYQTVVCPVCRDTVQAQTHRSTAQLLVGLHAPGGYLCPGTGGLPADHNAEPCPACGILAAPNTIH